VTLQWPSVAGTGTYNLRRSTTNNGPYTVTATGLTSTNYLDGGLANGKTYYYVVSTVNLNGEGANSVQASATPQSPLPAAPAGLTAAGGVGAVTLTWNASALATNYNLKRSLTSGGPYTNVLASTAATGFKDTNVVVETVYFYVVSALNGGGESTNSVEVSAAPHAPPQLGVNLDPGGGQLVVSWPGWAANFSLWLTTNLSPPITWSPVTNTVTPGDPLSVTVPLDGESRFFRLIAQ
jgi:hypothetical protein